jgi:carbonic anhydrase
VDSIEPGLSAPNAQLSPEAQLERAVEDNVRWSIQQLLATPEGKSAVEEGRAHIVGAIYEIANGQVRFLQ